MAGDSPSHPLSSVIGSQYHPVLPAVIPTGTSLAPKTIPEVPKGAARPGVAPR
jgi:hypothetical protein